MPGPGSIGHSAEAPVVPTRAVVPRRSRIAVLADNRRRCGIRDARASLRIATGVHGAGIIVFTFCVVRARTNEDDLVTVEVAIENVIDVVVGLCVIVRPSIDSSCVRGGVTVGAAVVGKEIALLCRTGGKNRPRLRDQEQNLSCGSSCAKKTRARSSIEGLLSPSPEPVIEFDIHLLLGSTVPRRREIRSHHMPIRPGWVPH